MLLVYGALIASAVLRRRARRTEPISPAAIRRARGLNFLLSQHLQ